MKHGSPVELYVRLFSTNRSSLASFPSNITTQLSKLSLLVRIEQLQIC